MANTYLCKKKTEMLYKFGYPKPYSKAFIPNNSLKYLYPELRVDGIRNYEKPTVDEAFIWLTCNRREFEVELMQNENGCHHIRIKNNHARLSLSFRSVSIIDVLRDAVGWMLYYLAVTKS